MDGRETNRFSERNRFSKTNRFGETNLVNQRITEEEPSVGRTLFTYDGAVSRSPVNLSQKPARITKISDVLTRSERNRCRKGEISRIISRHV